MCDTIKLRLEICKFFYSQKRIEENVLRRHSMHKKLWSTVLTFCLAVIVAGSFVGCGNVKKPTGSNGGTKVHVELDADIVASLDETYVPDVESIQQYSGKIDIHMILGKLLPGWEAVAREYERLQGGSVIVNVAKNLSSGSYGENLQNALNSSNTDWDIVQGNYQNALITSKGYNMYSAVSTLNPYAGKDVYWDEVMSVDAYQTDKSGATSSVYILNSENLSTGWFVQNDALAFAVENGYSTEDENNLPVTWDDIIELCKVLKEKGGYTAPLGIAGDKESVNSSQFAWLYRVYGDQYYREETKNIMPQPGDSDYAELYENFAVEDTDLQPESNRYYMPSMSRLMHLVFDKTGENYIGPTSDKFVEFLGQINKMKPYLSPDFQSVSHDNIRSEFQYQTKGKGAPQVFLDYAGYYLSHTADKDSKGSISVFDYPYMQGEYVEYKMVRDVGGNGGYISIINHDDDQNELNLDFVKFFMSPYGQSVYYRALNAAGVAPDGISTVEDGDGNSIFSVPEAWATFFDNNVLSFNGLADMSMFTNNMIFTFGGDADANDKIVELVWYMLGKNGTYTPQKYADEWYDTLFNCYKNYCSRNGWNQNMYQHPEKAPTDKNY